MLWMTKPCGKSLSVSFMPLITLSAVWKGATEKSGTRGQRGGESLWVAPTQLVNCALKSPVPTLHNLTATLLWMLNEWKHYWKIGKTRKKKYFLDQSWWIWHYISISIISIYKIGKIFLDQSWCLILCICVYDLYLSIMIVCSDYIYNPILDQISI